MRFVFDPFKLTDGCDVVALAAAIESVGGADVVVIDTLNRAAPGLDENSSQDMGRILEGLRELQAAISGLVLMIHHPGKDPAKGMRGHSSLFAALDVVIEVSRTVHSRQWRVRKAKDGQDGEAHQFELAVTDLGSDEDGERSSSCVVTEAREQYLTGSRPLLRVPKGGNQKIVHDVLSRLFLSSIESGCAGAPQECPCITFDEAVKASQNSLKVDPKRRAERARKAITDLIAAGFLGSNDGWLWSL